eukprot:2874234-Rhodomonas_salina.1
MTNPSGTPHVRYPPMRCSGKSAILLCAAVSSHYPAMRWPSKSAILRCAAVSSPLSYYALLREVRYARGCAGTTSPLCCYALVQ